MIKIKEYVVYLLAFFCLPLLLLKLIVSPDGYMGAIALVCFVIEPILGILTIIWKCREENQYFKILIISGVLLSICVLINYSSLFVVGVFPFLIIETLACIFIDKWNDYYDGEHIKVLLCVLALEIVIGWLLMHFLA